MANLGDIKIALDYQVQKQGPLDARLTRKTKSELIDINAWPHEGNVVYVYKTMLVGIEDTGETYKLIDPSKMFESDYSGWELVKGSGEGGSITIDDVLSATSTNPVTSKAIKEYVDLHPQYARINEIEAPEIDLGGGGTTTSGIQALEVKYNWDGTPLSDEDKAANANVYSKLNESTNYIIFMTGALGQKITLSIFGAQTEDYPAWVFLYDDLIVSESGIVGSAKYSLNLMSDGNIEIYIMPPGFSVLPLQSGMTIQDVKDNINAAIGIDLIEAVLYGFTCYVSESPVMYGHIIHSEISETRIFITTEHPVTGAKRVYTAVGANEGGDGILRAFTMSNGSIFVDSSLDVHIEGNQNIFANTSYVQTYLRLDTFQVVKSSKYYIPISWDIHTSSQNGVDIVDYVLITICDAGTFETWRINSDGTTQKIS